MIWQSTRSPNYCDQAATKGRSRARYRDRATPRFGQVLHCNFVRTGLQTLRIDEGDVNVDMQHLCVRGPHEGSDEETSDHGCKPAGRVLPSPVDVTLEVWAGKVTSFLPYTPQYSPGTPFTCARVERHDYPPPLSAYGSCAVRAQGITV